MHAVLLILFLLVVVVSLSESTLHRPDSYLISSSVCDWMSVCIALLYILMGAALIKLSENFTSEAVVSQAHSRCLAWLSPHLRWSVWLFAAAYAH